MEHWKIKRSEKICGDWNVDIYSLRISSVNTRSIWQFMRVWRLFALLMARPWESIDYLEPAFTPNIGMISSEKKASAVHTHVPWHLTCPSSSLSGGDISLNVLYALIILIINHNLRYGWFRRGRPAFFSWGLCARSIFRPSGCIRKKI